MDLGLFGQDPDAPLVNVATPVLVNVVREGVPLPRVMKVAASGRMDVALFDHRDPSVVPPDGNEPSMGKAAPETGHHENHGQNLHFGLPVVSIIRITHVKKPNVAVESGSSE